MGWSEQPKTRHGSPQASLLRSHSEQQQILREHRNCDFPIGVITQNTVPTSTDPQLKAHFTRPINLFNCFKNHLPFQHANVLKKEHHNAPHACSYHLSFAFSTVPTNFMMLLSSFSTEDENRYHHLLPHVILWTSAVFLPGWSWVYLVAPYTAVVLHLWSHHFFFFPMLVSVNWRKGEVRQIACDIQYLDMLKMHVHGRIMFSFYSFVFCFFFS